MPAMRYRLTLCLVVVTLFGALGESRQAPALKSGIDRAGFDTSVRPQDDFFRYVNGGWFTRTAIPDDHTNIGSFVTLRDEAEKHVQALIGKPPRTPGARQIVGAADRRFYASYLNESKIEATAGRLSAELDKIAAIKTPADLRAGSASSPPWASAA